MHREHRLDLPPYRAPAWLPGGHAQTIYPALFMWRRALRYRREGWVTPDLDTIVVDWVDGRAGTPIVVLFHGLEGGSGSHYARALFQYAYPRGWRGVVPHFRTCGNVINRLPRAYHAGDSKEIDWVLTRLRQRFPDVPIYAVGVSLGGNALLKWLGESGSRAALVISAAAAVCAPVDLAASGAALDTGVNRHLYTREFLRTLRRKTLEKLKLTNNPFIDRAKVGRAMTLREFDDLVTAPLHGFHSVDHYWREASSKPHLKNIAVPTLMVHALNDPFVPAASLPGEDDVSPSVTLLRPKEGGHVGFVSGPPPGKLDWLPNVLVRFFMHHAPLRH
ncbi:alpha/beta hydrolase [Chitiniphilus shinanonensis]|uniref:Alpha/beta hydrolase n=1 Tax=Chitiniphilus shinanonensis TaxID=553088 RepID=A0ABQ6BPA5_9NEIS|nr:alpha/beta fold hydrolase [Chitiniphilus shinanonensis]GLS03718.1 alpha/beta hydrolase [Chitiniphilus shinanonensis]